MCAAQINISSLPSLGSATQLTSFSTTALRPLPNSLSITSSEFGLSTTARMTALLTVPKPFFPNAPSSVRDAQYAGGEADSMNSNRCERRLSVEVEVAEAG